MAKKKFNQDEFGWTLHSLRKSLNEKNNIANQELKQQREIAEKQLEVKDRVDLSLKEYNEMRQEIKNLKSKIEALESNNDFLEGIIKELHIEDMLQIIDHSTLRTAVENDEMRRKQIVHIRFEIEPLKLGE